MKGTCLLGSLIICCLMTSVWATPTIEFSPSQTTWSYDGNTGILTYNPIITVDRADNSTSDPLIGAQIILPAFQVVGSDGMYTLTPIGDNIVIIQSLEGEVYLTAALQEGDMFTFGTIAGAYTQFQPDLLNIHVTTAGSALGSGALDKIIDYNAQWLDLELSMQGAQGPGFYSFAAMIDGSYSGEGGFSGAIGQDLSGSIQLGHAPAPGGMLLGSFGTILIGWLKRNRMC